VSAALSMPATERSADFGLLVSLSEARGMGDGR
jgi:hypothetical protein